MCRGLFKFFSCETYRDDFLKGHLHFNSLNYFRRAEASDSFLFVYLHGEQMCIMCKICS